jgi:NADPH:quinone reductase-like Zn-dependent oxidoreductase
MRYRRIEQSGFGGPEVLRVVEAELPEPGTGEVWVEVDAAGVAFGDVLRRRGVLGGSRSVTPGYDFVGRVTKQGAGVTSPRVGQVVAGLPLTGGYAEAIRVAAAELVPLPDGLDPAEAVGLVLNYVTAWQLLHRAARVQRGERVLVHGAAGGVGTALLDLARLAGVEAYGTASAAKHDVVREYGGTPIDYRKEDFVARLRELTGDGVDAVFDPIGGTHLRRPHRTPRRGGRLVAYGVSASVEGGRVDRKQLVLTFALLLALKLLSPRRSATFYTIRPGEPFRSDLETLASLLAAGKIRPLVARRLPLAEAPHAQELLEHRAVTGKIVLLPRT